jgi:flagella basal body P-ring formation protein FlgA
MDATHTQHAPRRWPGRAFWLAAVLCAGLALVAAGGAPTLAAPQSAVPTAVWKNTDHGDRHNKPQPVVGIPHMKASSLALSPDAQKARSAKATKAVAEGTAEVPASGGDLRPLSQGDWRLKIPAAAVVNGEMVTLKDIATPLGQVDAATWDAVKEMALWPAPKEEGKPLQVNRSRLSHALRQALGPELASRCILPTSLVLQRGGVVFLEDDLRTYVVKSLTPQLEAMPGEAQLHDFRLPDYIFLAHAGQKVQLEPGKLAPGRVTLRFAVQEADGTVLRKVAGMCALQLWVTVPAAGRPLNRGDTLSPQGVTFLRVNAAQLKDVPWNGQGGPWRLTRALTTGEPILQSDLVSELVVRRGDVVDLIYERGNVRMVTKGEALSDGEPGATIAVRNLQSKRQVYGSVRDGSTVIIR